MNAVPMTQDKSAANAVSIISEKMGTENAPEGVRTVQEAGKSYSPDKNATGMVVEYEDGTVEVFIGNSTDPYKQTDWQFVEVRSHKPLIAFKFPESHVPEPVSMGVQTIRSYQEEMDERLVGSYPVFAEGPDTYVGEQMVRAVVVL